MPEAFEKMLTGGHPNSLGRTIEVVDTVLKDPARFEKLFNCYGSDDEVVRLRVSNAVKRGEKARHDLVVPYIDRLIEDIGALDQASAQGTPADLFGALADHMESDQRARTLAIMKRNLAHHSDCIVLNRTMYTLVAWAKEDADLATWLALHLERLSKDDRKSVSKRASKALSPLSLE